MLRIENLTISVGNERGKKVIVKDFSLHVNFGEVHVLFGPNGSGKSTITNAILGYPGYNIESGTIKFKGKDITNLPITERAKMGIGVVFQYPPSIRGITLNDMANVCLGRKAKDIDARTRSVAQKLRAKKFLNRDVNYGFSGGEKKRAEVLQVLLQEPDFLLLDEPDSGVDVENVELIGKILNKFLQKDEPPIKRKRSGLIITHMGYILNFINTDRAHVLCEGRYLCSGETKEILDEIMRHGFDKCITTCLVDVKEGGA